MLQRRPDQVRITTPKGTVLIPRRLFDLLETRMEPDDLGLLRDYDWWRQLSELIGGIQFAPPAEHQEAG